MSNQIGCMEILFRRMFSKSNSQYRPAAESLEECWLWREMQVKAALKRMYGGRWTARLLFLGGVLSIKARNLGGTLELAIGDTGCGIAPELISRIQEPFFTTKPSGNGLGLAICRSIIRNVGGRMEIESRVGAGTQITVLLPAVFDKRASNTA